MPPPVLSSETGFPRVCITGVLLLFTLTLLYYIASCTLISPNVYAFLMSNAILTGLLKDHLIPWLLRLLNIVAAVDLTHTALDGVLC